MLILNQLSLLLFNISTLTLQIEFSVALEGKFDFSKCRKFTIRGYNKAGLYSTVSAEVKDCSAFDPVLIKPNIVIDAVGKQDPSRGKGICIYQRFGKY